MQLGSRFNQLLGLTGLFALALSATMAMAETRETIRIQVKTDDGLSEAVSIENLAVGETEVYTTDSGREVLVTRHDEGLDLELDGRVINVALPHVSDDFAKRHMVFMTDDGEEHVLEGDAVFVTKDDAVVIDGLSEHHVIMSEGDLHEHCADGAECTFTKRIEISTDGEGAAMGEDGKHIIKRVGGDEVEIDVEAMIDDLDLEGLEGLEGDERVIVIKREHEIHEESDDDSDQ